MVEACEWLERRAARTDRTRQAACHCRRIEQLAQTLRGRTGDGPPNLALKKPQAVRLLRDLERLLRSPGMILLACLASAGCSARVGVERGSGTDATATETSSTQISRTTVELDFQPRSPQSVSQPEPPPVTVTVAPEPQPVIVTGNTVIFSYREGDTHNETHIHVHDAPQRYFEETVMIRREVPPDPPRPVDRRCEQLRREHDERVRRWKAFPLGE